MAASSARSAAFVGLLRSGEYSDLKFVCQGEEFQVHKAVEAATGVIEIENFEPDIVRSMVEFLYTGDYSLPTPKNDATPLAGPAQPIDCEPPDDASGSDGILYHVRVGVIADYYNIPGLAHLANTRIQAAAGGQMDEQELLDATKESLNAPNDHTLRDTMASLVARNLPQLLCADQKLSEIVGELGVAILRHCDVRFSELDRSLQETRKDAGKAAARERRLRGNLQRCLDTLVE
ncbi:hypothetical protein OQA88_8971 [Cercophora sp. LCS_1]